MPKKNKKSKKNAAQDEKLSSENPKKLEEDSKRVDLDLSEPVISEESELEELAESSEIVDTSDFSEFMIPRTSETPSASLQQIPVFSEQAENLEESASSSISTAPETPSSMQKEYLTVYNQPEYLAGSSEEKIVEGLRRSNRMITTEQIREIRPRVEMEEWHELGEARGARRESREYIIAEADDRHEGARKLPFEEKRKYKEVRR